MIKQFVFLIRLASIYVYKIYKINKKKCIIALIKKNQRILIV